MYIRKKKNRSGSITVVAVSKARGYYKEVRNFGTAESADEVACLYTKALCWLKANGNQLSLDFDDELGREREETARVVDNMDAVLLNGTQLLLN